MRLTLLGAGHRGERSDSEYILVWTLHHSLLDGRAYALVLQEVFSTYEAVGDSGTPRPSVPVRPYRDYVDWLGQLDVTEAGRYWRRCLEGFIAPTPLVVDHPQRPSRGERYGRRRVQFSRESTAALEALVTQHSLTVNTLVQGAWSLLLHRYSGERDILFGATRACRRSTLDGAESMLGVFMNTLPVRTHIDPGMPLLPWLKELRAQSLAVRNFEHVPLTTIQEWSDVPTTAPLFQSILVFEHRPLNTAFRALGGQWEKRDFYRIAQTTYPLTVTGYAKPTTTLEIVFDRYLFDDDAVERMLGHLTTLLEGIVSDPYRRLEDLPLLTQQERHQILVDWNDTRGDFSLDRCLHESVFEPQVRQTPNTLALVCGNEALTYRELNSRANRLAHYLRGRGVQPETFVGICMERSPEFVVGILGVLKAGGAYVPMDPADPAERLASIMADTKMPVLLTQQSLLGRFSGRPRLRTVCLDSDWVSIAACRDDDSRSGVIGRDPAYAIYTSGSTGKPKGVLLRHEGLVNMAQSDRQVFDMRPGDRMLHFLPFTFDAATHHMFLALCAGATLHLAEEGLVSVWETLRTEAITHAAFPPSILAALPTEPLPDLRTILVGAEPCPPSLVSRWSKGRRFFNLYGPTEATIYATVAECQDDGRTPPIGRPICNTRVYLLDERRRPVPVGVPGELYIGGPGVASGYLNDPELTAEKFVADPFSDRREARLYKTGDMCRFLSDGQLEFLGRIDQQVKVRGFRIELGEVETAIRALSRIKEAIVLCREDRPQEKQLVAYVVSSGDDAPDEVAVLKELSDSLPNYMRPSAIMFLPSLPLNPNGKVDREALPAPTQRTVDPALTAHMSPTEVQIATVWQQALGVEEIGMDDSFFELGGHSMLLVRVHGKLRSIFAEELSMVDMFKYPTVKTLAHFLTRDEAEETAATQDVEATGTLSKGRDRLRRLRLRKKQQRGIGEE